MKEIEYKARQLIADVTYELSTGRVCTDWIARNGQTKNTLHAMLTEIEQLTAERDALHAEVERLQALAAPHPDPR